jgi:hypothetical protein
MPLGADQLTLQATLQITASASASGYFADLIVGDPPAPSSHVLTRALDAHLPFATLFHSAI